MGVRLHPGVLLSWLGSHNSPWVDTSLEAHVFSDRSIVGLFPIVTPKFHYSRYTRIKRILCLAKSEPSIAKNPTPYGAPMPQPSVVPEIAPSNSIQRGTSIVILFLSLPAKAVDDAPEVNEHGLYPMEVDLPPLPSDPEESSKGRVHS